MGRSKKNITSPGQTVTSPAGPSPTGTAALEASLRACQAEIGDIHAQGNPELVATALRLAGLHQRAWDLEGQLSPDINVRLACARQSASWAEQGIRCAKALQVDLLRELFTKAEAMQRHSSSLKDLK